MVCFKRKPVQYVSEPAIKDDSAEIWIIPETWEVFANYESYLQRMDYYNQKLFACQLTGHSGLNFFKALESEKIASESIDRVFPDALKEPVLRKVQFSTVSRIDTLVDHIYEEFNQVYYPGELVTVTVEGGERLSGTVRAKTKFPEIRGPDGLLEQRPFSRYFVALHNRPSHEALVDDEHIMRDRKSFTKQVLRSFIKNNVTREAWTGAPWLVKEHVAEKLKIDTEVPDHLLHGYKLAGKKAQLAQRRSDHDGSLLNMVLNSPGLPELKPATKSQKGKQSKQQLAKSKRQQYLEYQQALSQHEELLKQSGGRNGSAQFIHADFPALAPLAAKCSAKPVPAPPVKYPIEDLDVPPSRDGMQRPTMNYLSRDTPTGTESSSGRYGIMMERVGPLLETWNTLNVFCQVLMLDSFTFDDYLESLYVYSNEIHCELVAEIHCALLKMFVKEEAQGGELLVDLPELPDSDDDDEETEEPPLDDHHDTVASSPPESVKKPRGRPPRSSLARSAVAEEATRSSRTSSRSMNGKAHRATEMIAEYGWIDRLSKRDFKQGGWEVIIVGILNQLSTKTQQRISCEELLVKLAPLDMRPTQETARLRYATLDINARASILQILCTLAVDLKSIRHYIEQNNELMTEVRKEKIEWQRARKAALEELRVLDDERKILLPENSTPPPDSVANDNGDPVAAVPQDEGEEIEAVDEREATLAEGNDSRNGRLLRVRKGQTSERKRKRGQEREKAQTPDAPAKTSRMSLKFKKLLNDIEKKKTKIKEYEKEIAKADEDLREIDCPRTRCLGKDRFWNRYWFLERNAMPWAGLNYSSTADAEYANGCIWVQGPDDLEREGFIELGGEEQRKYQKAFQMTVVERKGLEEGSTSLSNARQWGYYDEPDSLDMLIGWLDVRGNRELKLRKELQNFRGKIIANMEKRKEYLEPVEKKRAGDEPGTRMSTRTKNHAGETSYRCMRWKNTMAMLEYGHLHSDAPKQRKAAKRNGTAKDTRSVTTNRKAKTLGRQGTRYDF